MQGKKTLQPKLFSSFNLADKVPEDNFYRRLKDILDLHFLYKETKPYYGSCGQKSLDPTVFFRLCLTGYLENITSDRQLIRHAAMRLDILYFIDHDIDDDLPWHSTISRTRELFPDVLFEQLFERVLALCVSKGMVSGRTQAIDSAPVKANASMESIELKVPEEELDKHLRKVRAMNKVDKVNKASKKQQTLTASESELKAIDNRQKNWNERQENRPGAKSKNAKYTSNHTHYSPTDPDARISVKPGKARKLNYHCQMAVDTNHHVITSIQADFADKHDSRSLIGIVDPLVRRLRKQGLLMENILADANYASGDNYADMEERGINAYIPPHGTFKGGPDHFVHYPQTQKEEEYYLCPNNKKARFRKVFEEKGTLKKQYATRRADCKGCPFKVRCIGNNPEKRFSVTYYLQETKRAIARVNSPKGQYYKRKRHATVEPVFGVLTQYMAMQKVTTKGIRNANKQFIMAALAYNLKKYLKFDPKIPHATALAGPLAIQETLKSLKIFLLPIVRAFLSPLEQRPQIQL